MCPAVSVIVHKHPYNLLFLNTFLHNRETTVPSGLAGWAW